MEEVYSPTQFGYMFRITVTRYVRTSKISFFIEYAVEILKCGLHALSSIINSFYMFYAFSLDVCHPSLSRSGWDGASQGLFANSTVYVVYVVNSKCSTANDEFIERYLSTTIF